MMRRKMMAAVMALAMMMTAGACTERGDVQVDTWRVTEVTEQATEDTVGIPNPFLTCETMEEAAGLAGFSMTVPGEVPGYEKSEIQVVEGELFQVFYVCGNEQVLIRKAAGSDDITGDYNDYSETDTAEANGSTVTLRGEDGMVKAASWQKDGYTYAIDATEGLPAETVLKLVEDTE